MGLVDDLNWKKEWAKVNLEAEFWEHLVSLPPEARKESITAERLAPQITVRHDHLQMDIKRVLYRINGRPIFEYRFYAIAKAFDYSIKEVRQLEVSRLGLTANEIAEEGGVSLRTAYRDMDDLQYAGFPISSEKEGKATRWRLMQGFSLDIPEPFTLTELLCLYLGGDLFNVFKGTVLLASQESVLEKIRGMFPPELLAYLDRIRSAYQMGGGPCKDYSCYSEVIGQIQCAAADRKTVEFGTGHSKRTNEPPARWILIKSGFTMAPFTSSGFATCGVISAPLWWTASTCCA